MTDETTAAAAHRDHTVGGDRPSTPDEDSFSYYLGFKRSGEGELYQAHLASKRLVRTDEDRELLRTAYVALTTAIDRWDSVVNAVKDRPR